MLLWGFWALVAAQSPGPAHLMVGLAVVAAALLVILAAAGVQAPTPMRSVGLNPRGARHSGARRLPRLLDPAAAGRPRPRAPSAHPAAA